ncbi:MAG: metallophosphoesterase [Prolixibacteraceae bacterium]
MFLKILMLLHLIVFIGNLNANNTNEFSFLVAGHAYGAHEGTNLGLHPPFLQKLESELDSSVFAIFLTGDIVNESTKKSWSKVANELQDLKLESYYIMGNHDENALGYSIFNEKHGRSYYALINQNNLFVVLNSTIGDRNISEEQLAFLDNELKNSGAGADHIYIFFHEVLWNSLEKYSGVLSNSRSRFNQIKSHSNYWEDVHPMLVECGKQVVVFTGDVAGNADAIPAFYDRWGNVTLVSSGMGEVSGENFIRVNVAPDKLDLKLIGLQDDYELNPIEFYSIPEMPDTIFGPVFVQSGANAVEYAIPEIFNSSETKWTLSEELTGESSENHILINFSSGFNNGTIRARAVHEGFGQSEEKVLKVSTGEATAFNVERLERKMKWMQNGNVVQVELVGFSDELLNLKLFDGAGNCVFQSEILNTQLYSNIEIACDQLTRGLFFLYINGLKFTESIKIVIH